MLGDTLRRVCSRLEWSLPFYTTYSMLRNKTRCEEADVWARVCEASLKSLQGQGFSHYD